MLQEKTWSLLVMPSYPNFDLIQYFSWNKQENKTTQDGQDLKSQIECWWDTVLTAATMKEKVQ